MRGGARTVVAVLLATLLSACTVGTPSLESRRSTPPAPRFTSSCKPPATTAPATGYRVVGCVADANGKPVRRPLVAVGKTATLGDLFGMTFAFAFSLGLSCLSGCVRGSGPGAPAPGNDDGTFRLALPEDARTGRYKALVVLAKERSTIEVFFDVHRSRRTIVLPPMVAWRPKLTVRREGRWVVPEFDRLPGETRGRGAYHLVLTSGSTHDVVRMEQVASGDRLDARLFTQKGLSWQVVSDAAIGSASGAYRSGLVEWRGAKAAPTAGDPCRYLGETGAVVEYGRGSCWATDGDLAGGLVDASVPECDPFARRSAPRCGDGDTWTELDLGWQMPVRGVVVHGVHSTSWVEVSDDRKTWREVARREQRRPFNPYVIDVPPGVSARYLRLVSDDAKERLRELAVYS